MGEKSREIYISVVIPVYNEENNVTPLHKELVYTLGKTNKSFEIIFINDGSTDTTLDELKKLSPIKVISFPRNFGKSQALQAGFDKATGRYVFTMDGDLQDDPSEVQNFLDVMARGDSDLIVGWKFNRKDGGFKKLSSKLANFVSGIFTGTSVHDMNCCFKLYKSEVAKTIKLYGDLHRYIPALAGNAGFKVSEMKVNHRRRYSGESKYGKSGLKRITKSLFDLLTVTLLKRFFDRPMHFFGAIGFFLSFFGSIILLYLGWIRIIVGENIGDRPLLLLGILMVVLGFQSFSLGFIGDLIKGSFEHRSFIVKENIENKQ